MKNKYQRMSKEDKKKTRERFYKTEHGKKQNVIFIRLIIYSVLCFGISIYMFIDNMLNDVSLVNYIIPFVTLIFGFVFIIGRILIANKEYNTYAINNK